MSTPPKIAHEEVPIGTSWLPVYELRDADDVVLDLSGAGVTVTLRIRKRGSTGAPDATRSTATPGDTAFPNGTGSDGQVQFLFTAAQTAALAAGVYDLEIVYEATGPTPDVKILHGRGSIEVAPARTGTL